ncbi:hypothetical protein [Arsenophonus nasoniae]|uniref:Uncharacterized protein n=1 Tax=Arsenophonus nasoniae TaxID=638 RepID=D2U0R7_9GAMM|nr:hypothetical protein [Arsenophonus nasoniae]CBA74044.1 conserved hypothetical protein [Arsenophonus nasoniae]
MFKNFEDKIPTYTIFTTLLCLNIAMLSVNISLSRSTNKLRENVKQVNESSAYLSDRKTLVFNLIDMTKENIEKALDKTPNQKMIKPSDLLDLGKKNEK